MEYRDESYISDNRKRYRQCPKIEDKNVTFGGGLRNYIGHSKNGEGYGFPESNG